MSDEELHEIWVGDVPQLSGPVELVEYDPDWPRLYEREAARIRAALGDAVVQLEHTGSTAVPGLVAKPRIDMLLVVPDSADEPAYVPGLEAAGYTLVIREPEWYEHRIFKGPDTDVNLHVFSPESPEIERVLFFRDRLRTNDADRGLYARTKRELAQRSWKYVQNYADAKSEVVEEIIARARQGADVVETPKEAEGLDRPPLLVLDRVRGFLDEHGLGSGPIRARRIGEGGGSNFTFLLERDDGRFVLRRPPRPPLPPSAHDMVREARLQLALAPHGIRLPPILAVGDDEGVIGVPFYVMGYLEGFVVANELPPGLDEAGRRRLGEDLVDTLVEIHAADVREPALAAFVRPGSYLERQVRRFTQLWEVNQTRELPQVVAVGRWLAEHLPEPLPPTVVHGDYRLGNVMVDRERPDRIVAVLDWEMGAIGDPRADVGYLLATYSEPGGEPSPLGTSPVTATAGFPSKAELVERYIAASGRDVEPLAWFEALALWKAAVFCEAIYGRYVRGELGAEDTRAARFELGVPYLAETAASIISA